MYVSNGISTALVVVVAFLCIIMCVSLLTLIALSGWFLFAKSYGRRVVSHHYRGQKKQKWGSWKDLLVRPCPWCGTLLLTRDTWDTKRDLGGSTPALHRFDVVLLIGTMDLYPIFTLPWCVSYYGSEVRWSAVSVQWTASMMAAVVTSIEGLAQQGEVLDD